jgi:hypothetical protein
MFGKRITAMATRQLPSGQYLHKEGKFAYDNSEDMLRTDINPDKEKCSVKKARIYSQSAP